MATLTVLKSKDYSSLFLLGPYSLIDFTNAAGTRAVATFRGAQFDGPIFVDALKVDGSTGGNSIVLTGMATGVGPNLYNWAFTNWGSNDRITLYGTDANDLIQGANVAITSYGGAGGDRIVGGADGSVLFGGAGDDLLESLTLDAAVTIYCGSGVDTAWVQHATSIGLNIDLSDGGGSRDIGEGTRLNGVENIIFLGHLSSGADHVIGGDGGNTFTGGAGNDTLVGGAYLDSFYGEAGDDLLTGGGEAGDFIFDAPSVLGSDDQGLDTITDFKHNVDRIIINSENPLGAVGSFISKHGFTGDGMEVRFFRTLTDTYIQFDDDGDKVADIEIRLVGQIKLTLGDFEFNF